MSTLRDFKDEEIAAWRSHPITVAMIEEMRKFEKAARDGVASGAEGGEPEHELRVRAGLAAGWRQSIRMMETIK